MKIINIRNYSGRNLFSYKPVIKMTLDIEDLEGIPTVELTGFNQKLLEWFPGLRTHYCSTGHEGGFVERLEEGTFASHVTEHLALELQSILGYDVYFGKTRLVEDSIYCIVYESMNEVCAIQCGRAAVEIVAALARSEAVPIDEIMERLQQLASEYALGPSTRAIINEARRRHIPVRRLGDDSLIQLGYGKHLRFIEASLADATSCISVDLAKNKQLSKSILQEQGLPVPEGGIVTSEEAALLLAEQLGYPVVVKPYDGNQGKGVNINVGHEENLRTAYHIANGYSNRVIIEKFIQGRDYRILVVGDQVSAAAERRAPAVIGDGIHTINELVAEENENPERGEGHDKPLTRIILDLTANELLVKLGLSPDSIPAPGEWIPLRENSNLSTGGSARDCTSEIHPQNKAMAVKAAKAIGLEIAGIDVVMDDISHPMTSLNGAIIEVNAGPGLRMHLYPTEGQGRFVAHDILNYLYPTGTPSSIPIISITGTNGKTTVTRMIHHVLSLTGKKVGMTCSSGTYIGDECISRGDHTGPKSAKSILYNREVEAAVLETARGGIIRRGLGYDLADVGVIVNVSEDHLGMDGIHTLEDMAYAKSLVVEAVRPDGYAVLNADDRMAEYIAGGVRCNLIYFSQNRDNPLIQRHIRQGGMAVLAENGLIKICTSRHKIPVLGVQEIPITYEGKVICNIENSLAAVASLLALKIPNNVIRLGLKSFRPDPTANAGRFNLFDLGDFQVMLDYGHNPSGYQSVLQFIKSLDTARLVGIIGMPGDRMDKVIYEVGEMSGQVFSKIYIKEDQDLRGRISGEVAGLLHHGALRGGANQENVEIVLSEMEALQKAIVTACPGDLIVLFYENFDPVFEFVQSQIHQSTESILYQVGPSVEQAESFAVLVHNYL